MKTETILALLAAEPEGLTTIDLAALTGLPTKSISNCVGKLAAWGKIGRSREKTAQGHACYRWRIKA